MLYYNKLRDKARTAEMLEDTRMLEDAKLLEDARRVEEGLDYWALLLGST